MQHVVCLFRVIMAKTNNTGTCVDSAHRFCVRGGAPDSDLGLGGCTEFRLGFRGVASNSDWL